MFTISVRGQRTDANLVKLVSELQDRYEHAYFVDQVNEVPWYPQYLSDLDTGNYSNLPQTITIRIKTIGCQR
jgi:hypothetical protein